MNKEYEYCLRCGRKLKNPYARSIGYGIVCETRVKIEHRNPLFGVNNTKQELPRNR